MRTDGQTDMTTIIVGFRNFANVPKDTISGTNTVKNYQNGNFLAIQLIQVLMQNAKAHFLASSVKHCTFFEHSSLLSAVARSLPFISTNPRDMY